MYERQCTSSVDEFLKENNFKKRGLTSQEVKNNLNKYQTNIYDIISTSNDEKGEEKIKQILEEVKNSQNVILIDIERLFNNEDSK